MSPPQTIYLALGTNLGDRPANLEAALAALPPKVMVTKRSPIYETAPWGVTDQPAFLNMVIQGQTRLAPRALLAYLKHLEKDLGRVPSFRYGPRLIDIDILFYGERQLETPELTLPHPHLHERAFVLVPLADLAPDMVHLRLGRTILELLADTDWKGITPYEDSNRTA